MNAISVREIKKLIAKYNKELDIREYGTLSKSALIAATTGKKPLNQALLSKLVRDAEKVRRQTNPKSMPKDDGPKALKKPSPNRVGQTKGEVSKEILDKVKGKKRVGETKGKMSEAVKKALEEGRKKGPAKKKEEKAKPKAAPLDRYRKRRQISSAAAAAGKERNLKKAEGDKYKKRREVSTAAAAAGKERNLKRAAGDRYKKRIDISKAAALEGAQRTAQRGADKSTALDALLSIAKTSTAGGRLGAARSLVNISAGQDPKAEAKVKARKARRAARGKKFKGKFIVKPK